MGEGKIFSGKNENEVWQQLTLDLASNADQLEYTAILKQADKEVELIIDIDPGGGFEGGYEFTIFRARINRLKDFRFAIHHQSFVDEIGKFFGMEDIILGYPEFDAKIIVKTNDELRAKAVLADQGVRAIFQSLNDFTFETAHHHIEEHEEKAAFLELKIELGNIESQDLRMLYHAFYTVLVLIEETEET